MNKPSLTSALRTGTSLICELVDKVLQMGMFKKELSSEFNGLFFYGAEDEGMRRKLGFKHIVCVFICIKRATRTVDVCVPSIASAGLANCLITIRQNKKVNIRVAIHNSDDFHNLPLLAQHGIEVKVIKPQVRLAHDFALVDAGLRDSLAVLGALDYETEHPLMHRDATLVTNEPAVLATLSREFQRIWNTVSDLECSRDSEVD